MRFEGKVLGVAREGPEVGDPGLPSEGDMCRKP